MQTTLMILVVLLGTLVVPVVAGAIYQAVETWRVVFANSSNRYCPYSARRIR